MANDVVYQGIGLLGNKAVDNMIPMPTPDVSSSIQEGVKFTLGILESGIKSQTDKTLEKINDKKRG